MELADGQLLPRNSRGGKSTFPDSFPVCLQCGVIRVSFLLPPSSLFIYTAAYASAIYLRISTMALPFPDSPFYRGAEAPCRFEAELYDCIVHGEIPKAIDGSFYRVMPDAQYAPKFSGQFSCTMSLMYRRCVYQRRRTS